MVIPRLAHSYIPFALEDRISNAPSTAEIFKMVLNAIMDRLSNSFIWVPVLFAFISLLYSRITARRTTPKDVPWIGKPTGLFAETRAHLSSFNNVRQWLGEGYKKVGVLPGVNRSQNHLRLTQLSYSILKMARHISFQILVASPK
jgi:hypothetical protein